MTLFLVTLGCSLWGIIVGGLCVRPRVRELEGIVRVLKARTDELTAENWRIMGELRAAQAKRRFLR